MPNNCQYRAVESIVCIFRETHLADLRLVKSAQLTLFRS
jgi:hypothetical protein